MNTHYHLDFPFNLESVEFSACNLYRGLFEAPMPAHCHGSNSYEVHCVFRGEGSIRVGEKTYSLTPGTLYVTGPGIMHEQFPSRENPMYEYCIYFQVHTSCSKKQVFLSLPPYLRKFLDTHFWLGQDTQNTADLFEKIFQELRCRYSGYSVQIELLLKQMLICLARNYEQTQESQDSLHSKIPSANPALIAEECFLYEYRTITLTSLAQQLGLSPRQTERFLKQQYKKTFLQMRNQARMSAAASYLMHSDLSVTRIAELTGYSSSEHFAGAFRKYFGTSAKAYRNGFHSS